jgi:O-antigen/teichoic acid export membrane protein
MLSPIGTVIVIGLVVALGISAVVLSVSILLRGKLYHRLKPEARPRRWVLTSLLFLFAVFTIWFPVWIMWPDALVSRVLLALFGITFFVVGVAFKWFAPLVDSYVKRKGWQLR